MKKVLKIVGIGFGILFVLGIIGSLVETEDTNVETVKEEEVKEETVKEEEVKVEEAIDVTADELIKAFKDNEVKGNDLYKDKLLNVTGTVKNIEHSDMLGKDVYYLIFGSTTDEFEIIDVRMSATVELKDRLMNMNKGDTITITGTCKGLIGGLYVDVEIMEVKE